MSKRCVHTGCNKHPTFGLADDRPSRCAEHKLDGMGDVVNNMCGHPGCTTRASYGMHGDRALRCAEHKLDGMENVKHKRCGHLGCKKMPCFGMAGDKPSRCAEHKMDGMGDVVNNMCGHPRCTTRASYGMHGDRPLWCAEHKLDGMENVESKRCVHPGCKKQPCFGMAGDKPSRCVEHKMDGMGDAVNNKCGHPGCTTRASYGMHGDRPLWCAEHKLDGMENVVSGRCAHPGCPTFIRRTKYCGFCLRCFMHLHPGAKLARSYKVKERHVVDALMGADLGLPSGVVPSCDKRVGGTGGCGSLRRPDWLVDLGTHSIIVEIDEEQHVGYDSTCETKRMMQLFCDLGDRPLVVVRFNPDAYTDDGGLRVPSPFKHHATLGVPMIARQKEWDARRDRLLSVVRAHVMRGLRDGAPSREVTVDQLFFDGDAYS